MTDRGAPDPARDPGADAATDPACDPGSDAASGHAAPSPGHRPNSVPAPLAKRILQGLFALCAVLALLDVPALIQHWRHEEHPWEALPVLYPLWGFVGISVLIVLSKGLRRLVMRPEDYYDSGASDAGKGNDAG